MEPPRHGQGSRVIKQQRRWQALADQVPRTGLATPVGKTTVGALLDGFRLQLPKGGKVPKFVFSSSIAVFGPDAAVPMPKVVTDTTLPAPQTSYGTQKLICEHLIADYTRKGYIDGRSARLMTVTVRPGKPNGAASSFFSGIIREPLAGVEAVCPVSPEVSHPVSSPQRTVEGLIAVFEASRQAYGGRTALNLPALNVRVGEMLTFTARPLRSKACAQV